METSLALQVNTLVNGIFKKVDEFEKQNIINIQ